MDIKGKRLIDAQPLVAKFENAANFYIGPAAAAFHEALEAVQTAPTVDAVEVVHGRWEIEWEYERDSITGECDETPVATCLFCGHKEYGFAYDDYWGKPYNYCPNCGAKMDGDGNE